MRQVDILRVWHLGDNIVFKEKKSLWSQKISGFKPQELNQLGGKKKKKDKV